MQNGGHGRFGRMKRFEAVVVDFVAWMQAFRPKDFVVLKIDVERAEREIIEGLLGNGTMRNVDILMWECHLLVLYGVRWLRHVQKQAVCRLSTVSHMILHLLCDLVLHRIQ